MVQWEVEESVPEVNREEFLKDILNSYYVFPYAKRFTHYF